MLWTQLINMEVMRKFVLSIKLNAKFLQQDLVSHWKKLINSGDVLCRSSIHSATLEKCKSRAAELLLKCVTEKIGCCACGVG